MIVKGRVKVKLKECLESYYLEFIVTFKDPDKIISIKRTETIWKNDRELLEEFLDRCSQFLNKEYFVEVGEKLVAKYFMEKQEDKQRRDKYSEIENQIRNLNNQNIEFEVEIDE